MEKTMKKSILIWNLILSAALLVLDCVYVTIWGSGLKALTCGLFAVQGLGNLAWALRMRSRYVPSCIGIALGLILSWAGDVLIGVNFVLGAGLFALGHVSYTAAFGLCRRFSGRDWLLGLGLFAATGAFVLLGPLTFADAMMRWVCFAYAAIISLMLGKALGNLLAEPSAVAWVMAIGAALFMFSDLMLVLDWFMDLDTGRACMLTYCPGQCLLAWSAAMMGGKTR